VTLELVSKSDGSGGKMKEFRENEELKGQSVKAKNFWLEFLEGGR
jgi:hypothetical protein